MPPSSLHTKLVRSTRVEPTQPVPVLLQLSPLSASTAHSRSRLDVRFQLPDMPLASPSTRTCLLTCDFVHATAYATPPVPLSLRAGLMAYAPPGRRAGAHGASSIAGDGEGDRTTAISPVPRSKPRRSPTFQCLMCRGCDLPAFVASHVMQAASDYCRAVGGELVPYLDDDGYGEQLHNALIAPTCNPACHHNSKRPRAAPCYQPLGAFRPLPAETFAPQGSTRRRHPPS